MAINFVVLASGVGSNFLAIQQAIEKNEVTNAKISALICNKIDAPVLEKAKNHKVPTILLESKNLKNEYETELLKTLINLKPDFILLAGYLKILGSEIISHFPSRIINIHPSLLPSFPGLNAIKQALDYGVKVTGVTVHFVEEDLDSGPIIKQTSIAVSEDDTEESLHKKIQSIEHQSYVEAIKVLISSSYKIIDRKVLTHSHI